MLITLIRVTAGVLLTRAAGHWLTKPLASKAAAVEAEARAELEELNVTQEDPDVVAVDYTESAVEQAYDMGQVAYIRGHLRSRRFVASMVTVLRAEFGAPTVEAESKVLYQATFLRNRTHLIKWCKQRHVRAKDIADNVDDAATLWFVPTRRDLRRRRIMASGVVAAVNGEAKTAGDPIIGGFLRFFLRALGHDVGGGASPQSLTGL